MVKIPSKEKIEWMVKNVPANEKSAMLKDLLSAAKNACETSNFKPLAEMIVDWEATIEAYKDPNFKKMAEGYRKTAKGNLEFAQKVFPLAREVLFRDEKSNKKAKKHSKRVLLLFDRVGNPSIYVNCKIGENTLE